MTTAATQRTSHTEARPALHRTPGLVLGPFYPARAASDRATPRALIEADMPGRPLELSGRLLDARGGPLAGALVELWHADSEGRYRHPDDPRVAEVDASFAGYTQRITDADGGWHVVTLVPGVYAEHGVARAPHVDVQVTHGAGRLVTQMFLPRHPLNESDRWYRAVGHPKRLVGHGLVERIRSARRCVGHRHGSHRRSEPFIALRSHRMSISRRRWLGSLAASSLSRMTSVMAQPAKFETAQLLCGYPPGGSIDVVSRALAAEMTGRYARTVLVDNKPGASGRLVVDYLKRAAPDGATLLVTPASVLTMYPFVYRQLSYDPLVDLVPVSMLASIGFALVVGPKLPASVRDVADFVAWCRTNPKAADCGNAGSGSLPHFLAMLLARDAGIVITHVPYKGSSAALQDAAGGQLSAVLATEASAMPLVESGHVRALATSWEVRSPFLPQVPTFKDQGLPRLTQREWFGAFLPKGPAAATVAAASDEMRLATMANEVRKTWRKMALRPEGSTAQELQVALRTEHAFWGPVIKASGFTPEA